MERVDKHVQDEIDDLRRKRAASKDTFRQRNGYYYTLKYSSSFEHFEPFIVLASLKLIICVEYLVDSVLQRLREEPHSYSHHVAAL